MINETVETVAKQTKKIKLNPETGLVGGGLIVVGAALGVGALKLGEKAVPAIKGFFGKMKSEDSEATAEAEAEEIDDEDEEDSDEE